jgi:hypothetical protein
LFENRALERLFGPKRDEVTRDWRKLHDEGLHKFYPSLSIITMITSRWMSWARHVARMEEKKMSWPGHLARMRKKKNSYKILMGMPEERRPLIRPRRKFVDNIKMNLKEIGWGDMDWIHLAFR